MYKGIVYCEANIDLYSNKEDDEKFSLQINKLSTFISNTVKITKVKVRTTRYDEEHDDYYTSLTVLAEVLVTFDPHISHIDDYRVKGCIEFRKHFPSAGAIMAHSIDAYNGYRVDGFLTSEK
ncbi:hypothetical protein [Bacillus alkalicellulosilyticus]|uniref:hypothetical protein n=1 Tax=Alkalihalobacterium alkalicellulosilyticum TaxID=1912214 RepID=UPI0009985F2A|nr:hypothetical protein [Bacillus alkalicellulosilyticus]